MGEEVVVVSCVLLAEFGRRIRRTHLTFLFVEILAHRLSELYCFNLGLLAEAFYLLTEIHFKVLGLHQCLSIHTSTMLSIVGLEFGCDSLTNITGARFLENTETLVAFKQTLFCCHIKEVCEMNPGTAGWENTIKALTGSLASLGIGIRVKVTGVLGDVTSDDRVHTGFNSPVKPFLNSRSEIVHNETVHFSRVKFFHIVITIITRVDSTNDVRTRSKLEIQNLVVKPQLHHSIGDESGTTVNFIQEQSYRERIAVIVLLIPIRRNEFGFTSFGINARQTNKVTNIGNLGCLEFHTFLVPNILCEPANNFGLTDTVRTLEHYGMGVRSCCENHLESLNIHNLFFPFCLW